MTMLAKITEDPRPLKDGNERCKLCSGHGRIYGVFPIYADHVPKKDRKPYIELPCIDCDGSGQLPKESLEWSKQGEILKDQRIAKRLTLRNASKLLNIDSSILGKMERGVIKPEGICYQ